MSDATKVAELELAIENAVKAHDIPAVGILLKQLALEDPDRAQVVVDTLKLGVEMARQQRAVSSQGASE